MIESSPILLVPREIGRIDLQRDSQADDLTAPAPAPGTPSDDLPPEDSHERLRGVREAFGRRARRWRWSS